MRKGPTSVARDENIVTIGLELEVKYVLFDIPKRYCSVASSLYKEEYALHKIFQVDILELDWMEKFSDITRGSNCISADIPIR